MGNCVTAWRAAIGLFYNVIQGNIRCHNFLVCHLILTLYKVLLSLFSVILRSVMHAISFMYRHYCKWEISVCVFAHSVYSVNSLLADNVYLYDFLLIPFDIWSVMLILLILSGDVEKNPGPSSEPDVNCLSVFSQYIRSIRNKFDYIKNN